MSHKGDADGIRRRRGRPHKNSIVLYAGGASKEERKQQQIEQEPEPDLLSDRQEPFPNLLDGLLPTVPDVKKDIYYRVLELAATTTDKETLRWQIIQEIFEYALVQMDAERRGIAMTYAALMPARADGIHSLYEVAMRGTEPWPFSLEGQAYLGSTTLAGTAAMEQCMLIWDSLDETVRWQVEVDEFEKSACACPVTRAGCIAGVLIISSAQQGFFANDAACEAVVEYARLLALAFSDDAFHSYTQLRLMPMPPIMQQREEIRETLMYRILSLARTAGLSRPEAAAQVRSIFEQEFEERMHSQQE